MITFETEYQLNQWREIKPQHFDSEDKAYTGQIMSRDTQEQMLRLINQLDCELVLMERSFYEDEKMIMNQMEKMCIESLPPDLFSKWEEVKKVLFENRKSLNK